MASSFDFHQWYSTIDLPTDYKDDVLYHFLKKELLVTRGALLGADFTLLRGELPIGAIGALVMAIEPLKKKSNNIITSHHITSHHIISYHIISYHIISYHIV